MATQWTNRGAEWDNAPNDYRDPYWRNLVATVGGEVGLTPEQVKVLDGIMLYGEQTNADLMPSPTKDNPNPTARGPFQVTKAYKDEALKNFEVDAWASPRAQVEAVARTFKKDLDEAKSLGAEDPALVAVAKHHGGPKWTEQPWAEETRRYTQRVASSIGAESTGEVMALGEPAGGRPGSDFLAMMRQIEKASPVARAVSEIEQRQQKLKESAEAYSTRRKEEASGPPPIPRAVMENYIAGKNNDTSNPRRMTPDQIREFEGHVRAGLWRVPVPENATSEQQTALAEKMARTMAGQDQMTAAAAQAGDWGDLPEMASLTPDERIAVMTAPVPEAAEILKAKFPALGVTPDEKGNIIFQSSVDKKPYAAKPTIQGSDLVRFGYRTVLEMPTTALGAGIGGLLGGPLGAVAGGALGAALGETAAQGFQAAQPGGRFDVSDVGAAGVIGGAVPVLAPVAGALARGTAQGVRRVGEMAAGAVQPAVEAVTERVRPLAVAAQMAQATPTPVPARIAAQAPTVAVEPVDVATQLSRMRAAPPGVGPAAQEAAVSAVRRVSPEAVATFREVQAQLPKTLPNAGRLSAAQADQMLPLMQRYRDAAEAVGNTQVVNMADNYMARARSSMAQPAAVARATVAPLTPEPRVFARAKVEPIKQAIKQAAPDVPEPVAEVSAKIASSAKDNAPTMSDSEFAQLIRDTTRRGSAGEAARLRLAELADVNLDDMARAQAAGFDVPEELFSDGPRVRSMIGVSVSQPTSEARDIFKQTYNNVQNRAAEILKQAGGTFVEGRPALGVKSDQIRDRMVASRNELNATARGLYSEVSPLVAGKLFKLDNLKQYFKERLKTVSRDSLSGDERKLLDMVEGAQLHKYGDIETQKTLIESAIASRRKPVLDPPYRNTDDRTLGMLKKAILRDQLAAVEKEGGKDATDKLIAAHALTARKKQMERRLLKTFGSAYASPEEGGAALGSLQGKTLSAFSEVINGRGIKQMREQYYTLPKDLRQEWIRDGFAASIQETGTVLPGEVGISPVRVIKFIDNINRSPFAKEFYDAIGPNSREQLDGLKAAMERIYVITGRETERTGRALADTVNKAKPTGVVRRMIGSNAAKNIFGGLSSFAGGTAGGAIAGPPGMIFGAGVSNAIGHKVINAIAGTDQPTAIFNALIKQDSFKKALVEAAKGKVSDVTKRELAKTPQWNMWLNSLGIGQKPKERSSFLEYIVGDAVGSAPVQGIQMAVEESTAPME